MDITRFAIDEHGTARLQTSKGVLMLDAADLHFLLVGQLELRKPSNLEYSRWYVYLRKRDNGKHGKHVSVARLIMNAPKGMQVDHISHDTLDNRRCNLRVCTQSENARNSSKHRNSKAKYKGVFYHSHGNYHRRWRAYTRVLGKRIWLGYYLTQEEAAAAYNAYVTKEFGAFANPNVLVYDEAKAECGQQLLAI
jgi:hypothetical protein